MTISKYNLRSNKNKKVSRATPPPLLEKEAPTSPFGELFYEFCKEYKNQHGASFYKIYFYHKTHPSPTFCLDGYVRFCLQMYKTTGTCLNLVSIPNL